MPIHKIKLKAPPNPQRALWRCEEQPKCVRRLKISLFSSELWSSQCCTSTIIHRAIKRRDAAGNHGGYWFLLSLLSSAECQLSRDSTQGPVGGSLTHLPLTHKHTLLPLPACCRDWHRFQRFYFCSPRRLNKEKRPCNWTVLTGEREIILSFSFSHLLISDTKTNK